MPATLYIPSVTSNRAGSSGGILHPCEPALHFETRLIRSPEAFLTSHTSLSHKNKNITSPVRLCNLYNSNSTSLYFVKCSQTIYQTQYRLYYKRRAINIGLISFFTGIVMVISWVWNGTIIA